VRKHRYGYSLANPLGFVCENCGHTTSLSAWQVEDMPPGMAECPSPAAPRAGLFERLLRSVDCLAREPFAPGPARRPPQGATP
jgi:hypothetical protein